MGVELKSGSQGSHHASRAAAGNHDVELPDRKFLGGFLVPGFRRFLWFFSLADEGSGWETNAQQGAWAQVIRKEAGRKNIP